MRRLVLATLLMAWDVPAQTRAADSSTLESLLAEVHQLRQDIESMTAVSQRVTIALYTLQMQDAAVARATARLDQAHQKCAGITANRDHIALGLQRVESRLADRSNPENNAKALERELEEGKRQMDAVSAEAQGCSASEAQLSSAAQAEQAKLAELQDRITRLDEALAKYGKDGK